MLKYITSTIKDILLLSRDKAGLAMLFIMPAALIIIMTLLQDSTFKALEERQLPVLIVDNDNNTFGNKITSGLAESTFFKVVQVDNNGTEAIRELKDRVAMGEYQIGIIIHDNATENMVNNIKFTVEQQFGNNEPVFSDSLTTMSTPPKIDIYFDPVTKSSFKKSITSALHEFSSAVEASMIFDIYSSLFREMLDIELNQEGKFSSLVEFETHYASRDEKISIPNSVQHNVPAWSIFAIFFIVIPLAGNIINERQKGVYMRLRVISGSYLPVIFAKVTTYTIIGVLQAIIMLSIGIFILPLMGMPQLTLGDNIFGLTLLTIAVSLAATGYGVAIGSLATSQEQASIFGSISVVILAAVGGIWVPTFIMSNAMQHISMISPLNWALNGYYDLLLRNAGLADIYPNILLLMAFFVACILLGWVYDSKRST